jgi:hypothetical protein
MMKIQRIIDGRVVISDRQFYPSNRSSPQSLTRTTKIQPALLSMKYRFENGVKMGLEFIPVLGGVPG